MDTLGGGCQSNSVRTGLPQETLSFVSQISNTELVARVKHLVVREWEAMASLIASMAELDRRRLYFAEGCSSMFAYCTQVLHLSEHAAYGRIEAARAARRFPLLLERLREGSVNLTTVGLLAVHLTPENHRELLDIVRHKSRRQVEELVARLRPQPPVPGSVRRLPTASPAPAALTAVPDAAESSEPTGDARGTASSDVPLPITAPPQARPAVVAPLAPQRYRVQFTASAETYEKIRLAQNLLRHQIPDGDPAKIFDRALTALLKELTRQKFGATDHPRETRVPTSGSRHIPAEVKRAVWMRDGGRCAFVGSQGRRCTEQGFLEFHHVAPHAEGGEPTADNIQLRCRAHNVYEAELHFGPREEPVVREARAPYSFRTEFIPGGYAGVKTPPPWHVLPQELATIPPKWRLTQQCTPRDESLLTYVSEHQEVAVSRSPADRRRDEGRGPAVRSEDQWVSRTLTGQSPGVRCRGPGRRPGCADPLRFTPRTMTVRFNA